MLDELRDEAAVLCGWHKDEVGVWQTSGDAGVYLWPQDGGGPETYPHPFEYGDLNAIARKWPEDVSLELSYGDGVWIATAGVRVGGQLLSVSAPTEYEARLRLLVAVKKEGE